MQGFLEDIKYILYMKTIYMKKLYRKNTWTKSKMLVPMPLHSTLHCMGNKIKSSEISYRLLSWNGTPGICAMHWFEGWNFLHRGWMHCIISIHYLFSTISQILVFILLPYESKSYIFYKKNSQIRKYSLRTDINKLSISTNELSPVHKPSKQ